MQKEESKTVKQRNTTNSPVKKVARKGKKRGPNRKVLTLGGEKRMQKAEKRRLMRMVNKE